MAASATGPVTATAPRISLDGTWQFHIEGEAAPRTIQVPGPWESQFPELEGRAVSATYTRQCGVPRAWSRTGVVRLHVGAADYFSEVTVNGYPAGTHEGGYLPFDLEIQEFLRFGPDEDNTITIRVSDGAPGRSISGTGDLTPAGTFVPGVAPAARPFPFTEIPHGKQSWYSTVGGIWQSCWLEHRHECFVDNVFVRPDVAHQAASVRVRSRTRRWPTTRTGCD
jgi:beta-galactosidase/beta-glucuronidase